MHGDDSRVFSVLEDLGLAVAGDITSNFLRKGI